MNKGDLKHLMEFIENTNSMFKKTHIKYTKRDLIISHFGYYHEKLSKMSKEYLLTIDKSNGDELLWLPFVISNYGIAKSYNLIQNKIENFDYVCFLDYKSNVVENFIKGIPFLSNLELEGVRDVFENYCLITLMRRD